MYITKLSIKGYCGFKDQSFEFHEGVNVIIGHNNAGKSTMLKALGLLLDTNLGANKKLTIDDFYKGSTLDELKSKAPEVHIAIEMQLEKGEDINNNEEAAEFGKYVKSIDPLIASFAFHFMLSDDKVQEYNLEISNCTNTDAVWKIIQRKYIRYYRISYNKENQYANDKDMRSVLRKFDYQALDAIRDVERDMFTGRNTLLHEVLDFFLDYDIKKDTSKPKEDKERDISTKSIDFENDSQSLISKLMSRMQAGEAEMLKYAIETGASFNNARPGFEGSLTESELFSALRLIVETMGIKVPATHNGLGYNNLIYISLLLAKMQASCSKDYLGSNAKLYPLLVVEEPEAHLHPSMQFKLLKFLKNQNDKVKQVFVTTHSTHITASVDLEDMIILHRDNGALSVGYPSKTFDSNTTSKEYVQRFLDATKSTMLFANRILFVEGIAEYLMIPAMARHLGIDLDDRHITVVNLGGRYYSHFLRLFDKNYSGAVAIKVACITDRDPMKKSRSDLKSNFLACYPFEYNLDIVQFEYKTHGESFVNQYANHPNIHFFTQPSDHGKTLEYEIAWQNPSCEGILTPSISNEEELKRIMGKDNFEDCIDLPRDSGENKRIMESLEKCSLSSDDKKKSLFAARYLNSVGKGENALELAYYIDKDAKLPDADRQFIVPNYIKEALEWLIQ